jgi:DnaK suppressor protein
MDSQLAASFEAALLLQRATLVAQIADLRGGHVGRAAASAEHFGPSEDTRAQANSARDLELALDARETAELAAVNAALQRINMGVYGQCVECGVEIAIARLKVAPEAQRCIGCQEKSESDRDATTAYKQ